MIDSGGAPRGQQCSATTVTANFWQNSDVFRGLRPAKTAWWPGIDSVRLERRGSGVGAGAGAGDGGSWAEAKDTGFGAEADACQREKHIHEIHIHKMHACEMNACEMHT